MSIAGSCLCGEVRYEVAGKLVAADHCHCSLCRRQHGAAFATYADFSPGDFRWVTGEGLVKVYERPSGAGWCFCGACGSSLAATHDGVVTSVTLGSVSADPGIRPDSHIYVGSKAIWYDIADGLAQFENRGSRHDEPTG